MLSLVIVSLNQNQVLEMALHSSGYQSQHKKLYQDELARLVEQEQLLLRQENERLTMELHNTKDDLHHSRDKVRLQRQFKYRHNQIFLDVSRSKGSF